VSDELLRGLVAGPVLVGDHRGLLGFSADLGRRTVRFDPKFDLEEFSCFWSHGRGWGTYRQERDDGTLHAVVEVLHGTLAADHVEAPVPVTVAQR
jgi:hypothetical protein